MLRELAHMAYEERLKDLDFFFFFFFPGEAQRWI